MKYISNIETWTVTFYFTKYSKPNFAKNDCYIFPQQEYFIFVLQKKIQEKNIDATVKWAAKIIIVV